MNRKNIEARMKRMAGMSAVARERMNAANELQLFTAKCRICGQTLYGTPSELAKHKHEV